MSTIEQQQILKAIYQKLYWEILVTSNLSEVQWAFISKSRNYTNMKQAIQHVLIAHRLIPWSGQAISSQNIVELFKENDPMTAICFT
jgi:hypothetical protein